MRAEVPDLHLERGPALVPSEPPDEVWCDSRGVPIARGWIRGGEMSMEFPGLGAYRFAVHGGPVSAAPAHGASLRPLESTYWKSVVPFVLQARGFEVLHASAIAAAGGVAAFCANSETGKSTLARALGRRGHGSWADDAVVLERDRTFPLPFQVSLRPESSRWFGEPELSTFHEPDQEHPLRAVFVLERDEAVDIRMRRISSAAAFPLLLRHAFCFTLSDPDRKRTMMARYMELAARVPVFELRFASGLERLDAISARVEETLAGLN